MLKQYIHKIRKHVYVKNNVPGIATVKEKVGVMVAFVDPQEPKRILIGFSKCHMNLDEFNKERGEQIATSRARCFHRLPYKKISKVPHSMREPLKEFAIRVSKYYKEAEIPRWIAYL